MNTRTGTRPHTHAPGSPQTSSRLVLTGAPTRSERSLNKNNSRKTESKDRAGPSGGFVCVTHETLRGPSQGSRSIRPTLQQGKVRHRDAKLLTRSQSSCGGRAGAGPRRCPLARSHHLGVSNSQCSVAGFVQEPTGRDRLYLNLPSVASRSFSLNVHVTGVVNRSPTQPSGLCAVH